MRSLGNLDTMAFCTCGYFPLLPFRIVLSNSRPDYKVFSNLVAGRRNHVVLISPTRLILMTSGEVDDAHLSALRAGLEDDITDQRAGHFGRFPAAIRIVQRLREEGRAAAARAVVGWPGPAVERALCGVFNRSVPRFAH